MQFYFLVDFQSTLGHIKSKAPPDVQRQAVLDLMKRIIPSRAQEFAVIIDPGIAPVGKDAFKVRNLLIHNSHVINPGSLITLLG